MLRFAFGFYETATTAGISIPPHVRPFLAENNNEELEEAAARPPYPTPLPRFLFLTSAAAGNTLRLALCNRATATVVIPPQVRPARRQHLNQTAPAVVAILPRRLRLRFAL